MYIYIYIYIYSYAHIYIYVSLYVYRICTSCIEREANAYADVHNICLTYISAHAWCSTTPVNARACAPMQTVQQLLGHGSYCELILSLVQTSCRLSFTIRSPAARGRARPPLPVRPPAALLPPVAQRCSLQKSVQIHASS